LAFRSKTKTLPKSRAVTTERDFPHIIEIDLPVAGLDFRLSREMGKFHEANDIAPRFGRTRIQKDHHYCRWCFSDPAVANAFRQRFGGAGDEKGVTHSPSAFTPDAVFRAPIA
jgi:hypothetical protein